jgi:hypothetical protein
MRPQACAVAHPYRWCSGRSEKTCYRKPAPMPITSSIEVHGGASACVGARMRLPKRLSRSPIGQGSRREI